MIKDKILLIIISLTFLLGLFLRVFDLAKIPISLTIDEVAVGYNAYSVLKTGRDEHGVLMPLAFRSIGDYKAPLLIYSMIPAIYLFGMTEFGVRITIALFGSLTVLAVFLLVLELSKSRFVSLISTFSLAISPWHIKFSRSSFEAVLALFLVILAVYLFIKMIRGSGKWFWLSAIFFSLSMYAYHAERVFTPLIVLWLGFIYRKELYLKKKQTLIAITIGTLSFIPLFITLLNPQARTRAEVTFITRDFEINSQFHKAGENRDLAAYVFDNNFVIAANFWAKRYLDYFDPNFLFVKGMGYSLPNSEDLGLLYLIELPLVLLGLFLIILKEYLLDKKARMLVLGWFLFGTVAASFANNAQHSLRALTWIPILQFLSAVGLYFAFRKLRGFKLRALLMGSYLAILLISLVYFGLIYGYVYQSLYSEGAMDGWKEAAKYALDNQGKYKQVVIDPRFGTLGPYIVGTPYLYLLFYGKIDPNEFQTDPGRKDFESSSNFRNFSFREINWAESDKSDRSQPDNLYIGSQWVLPAREDEIHQKFYLLNGKEILRAASPK